MNKRAINGAFKAIRFTPKANAAKIRRALRLKSRLNAPLASLILNKLQGKYGRKGYYGAEMRAEEPAAEGGKGSSADHEAPCAALANETAKAAQASGQRA